MEQLIHPVNIQPKPRTLQQHAEVESCQNSIAAEAYGFNWLVRDRRKTDRRAEETANSTCRESLLLALYKDNAETGCGGVRSEAALRKSQEELRQLSVQLLNVQESERQRIAADLHDGIGQSLSLIKLSLETVMQQLSVGDQREALQSLQQLTRKTKETMDELHRTTMDLRPSMLDDLGIIPTLSWFFREFESAWCHGSISREIGVLECDVPVSFKATIFRILQEAMNNIVKHANADKIQVSLTKSEGSLQLSIEDNGCGFNVDKVSERCMSECCSSSCGFGLLTMKERARSSGGFFEISSTPRSGTRILIFWLLTDQTEDELAADSTFVRESTRCGK